MQTIKRHLPCRFNYFIEYNMNIINKETSRGRFNEILIKTSTVLAAGGIYALFVRLTGIGLPCIIKFITKKHCPGCGISRMLLDILQLDFVSAFHHNMFLFCLLPFAFVLFVYKTYVYVKSGKTDMSKWETILYIIVFILMIAFWIMRNMPQFTFLAP